MNNKFYVQEISDKNQIKLHRNSSLDSTKSSLRVKKIKLHNELSPFIKITQNPNKRNILDFPICMSLFTNNYSLYEKDKKSNNNSGNKLNIKYQNFKNNLIKNNEQKELLLPKAKIKKIISRNDKGYFIHSFSPINSIVKSSILNHNNNQLSMQSSRNISKPILKKINYSSMLNFTNRADNSITILKRIQSQKKNNNLNSTIEQEISAIKNLKNLSIGKINSNIGIKNKKVFKLPKNFFYLQDNSIQKENFSTSIFDVNEINKKKENINEEKKDTKINKNKSINKTIDNKLYKSIILENINESIEINKKKESIINNKIQSNNLNQNKNINFNSDKRSQKNEINKNEIIEEIRQKLEIDNKIQAIKKNEKKDKALTTQKAEKIKKTETNKNKSNSNLRRENKKNEAKKNKSNSNLMIEEEALKKIKNAKFYLAINYKKTNEIYSNNYFLNSINKEIAEKSINNSTNTKVFLQKTEMLIKNKDLIEQTIIKRNSKLKQIETIPLSQASKQKIMSYYFEEIYNNKNKLEKKNEISKKKIIFFYINNCNIRYILRDYIFATYDFGELSLENPINKNYIKKGTFIRNSIIQNDIRKMKRNSTFLPTQRISIDDDLEDGFILKKTKNNIKKDIKLKNNPVNLICIQNYILKSLPFNNDNYMIEKNIEFLANDKTQSRKSKFNYKLFNRNLTKNLALKKNIGFNSTKMILSHLKRENSLKIESAIENELGLYKLISKKDVSLFNIDNFTRNLKKQLSKKSSDSNIDHYSILQRKNFFKKTYIVEGKIKFSDKKLKDLIGRDSIDYNKGNNLNDKDNENGDKNLEGIYVELIKFAIEGKNKNFEKYFENNRKSININQELIEGNTLLILCAREGNYHITKFLCEEKAEVNLQNNNGNTALHYAIGKHFYAIADILTRYGAREDIKNDKGLTPWDCMENNIE